MMMRCTYRSLWKKGLLTFLIACVFERYFERINEVQSSNTVIDSFSKCSGYKGVLHIRAADRDAAAATLFFMYVINHIIYAKRHNLIPWVHLESSNKNTFSIPENPVLMKQEEELRSGPQNQIDRKDVYMVQRRNGNLELHQRFPPALLWESRIDSRKGPYFTKLYRNCNLITRRGTPARPRETVWQSHSRPDGSDSGSCILCYNMTKRVISVKNGSHSGYQGTVWKDLFQHQPCKTAEESSDLMAEPANFTVVSKVVHPEPFLLPHASEACLVPVPGRPMKEGNTTELTFAGHGIWNAFFQPISLFDWKDLSCASLPLVQIPYEMIVAMHLCEPSSVRSWVYDHLSRKDRPRTKDEIDPSRPSVTEWFGSMRRRASILVKNHFEPLPWLQRKIDALVDSFRGNDCLAIHVRHTDKGDGREKVPTSAFLPYAEAYVQAGGKCIFLATDSAQVWGEISRLWPLSLVRCITVQPGVFRSSTESPTFVQADPSRINKEILIEIYAMSRCAFFVHGFSAVSESVIYLNPQLHNNSVNLDLPEVSPSFDEFEKMVAHKLQSHPSSQEIGSLLCFRHDMVPKNYIMQNASFIPDPRFSYCGRRERDLQSKELNAKLFNSQNPESCVNYSQMLTDRNTSLVLGNLATKWVESLMYAVDNGIQFWSPRLGMSKKPVYCTTDSTACWFEPVSACEATALVDDGVECSGSKHTPQSPLQQPNRAQECIGYAQSIPKEYRNMGGFWYYSQLLAYLMRPNYRFWNELNIIKKDMNWSMARGPVLALHVWNEHNCTQRVAAKKSQACGELEAYMGSVNLLSKQYNITSIFLSTNSREVIENTRKYNGFTWLYQKHEESTRREIEWDKSFTDIFLLAEGDVFVGKFTSPIARIAYSLMTTRKGSLAPYVSLDSPWGL